MGKTAGGILKTVVGVGMAVLLPGVGTLVGASLAASGLKDIAVGTGLVKKPRVNAAARDRLFTSFDPSTPRKIVFGRTAMATDLRYEANTGTDQEYYHQIIALASHKVEAIEELWFESEMAWSVSGGVIAKYTGYLTVAAKLEGTSGNTVSIDSNWGSDQRLTGVAYLHLRFKRTGNTKKAESPFAQSIPSRVTVRGKGMFLPDVREGGVDADDQSTWDWFDDDSGRNPALQLLAYLIGWRINGKLAVGRGFPASRFDLDSFITAANHCDETVTKADASTEPRYRSDGVFSEADDPGAVIANLLASMNAVMRDAGGRLSLTVLHNDLAVDVVDLDEGDILGDESWQQTLPLDETFNAVRGRYTDPSNAALYQLVDAPEVSLTSVDGIERIESFDAALVQSPSQWQRLAKQRLQRAQYQGVYSANFRQRAWAANLGRVVRLQHPTMGWADKLFRAVGQTISVTGVCRLVLREEHPDIYLWDAEEAPAVEAAAPTVYDYLNDPVVLAIEDAALTDTNALGFAEITIHCDYLGNVLESSIPASGGRDDTFKLYKNGVLITSGVTWAREVMSGSITCSISGTGLGVLNTTAMASGTAEVRLVATYEGRDRPWVVKFSKLNAPAPNVGSGGGGGTAATDTTFPTINSTTHAVVSEELSITVGSGGSAALTASLGFTGPNSSVYSYDIHLKWQYDNVGVWTDVTGGEEVSSYPASRSVDGEGTVLWESGIATISRSHSASGAQKYRLMARLDAGTRVTSLAGNATAQG